MSPRLACCVFVLVGMCLHVAADERLAREVRANGWHTDYAAARNTARQSGKPLFVVFRCQP